MFKWQIEREAIVKFFYETQDHSPFIQLKIMGDSPSRWNWILVHYFNNNDKITITFHRLTLFYLKCAKVITSTGSQHHKCTKYTELDAPYFKMWLTMHTVLLTNSIRTSIIFYNGIILCTKQGKCIENYLHYL